MKKMENILRRALSMLLSICMLFGNMGGVLAESVPSVVSESTGPLMDHIIYETDQGITTELSLAYVGAADRVWNGSAYYDAANLCLWYNVDIKVTKDADDGWLKSVGFKLESSEKIEGNPKIFLYRADRAADLANATPLGSDYQMFSQVDNGTKLQVKASNYGSGGYGMPQGVYRFMVGLPVSESKAADMLNNGASVTVNVGTVSVNDVTGSNTTTRDHTASFAAPTVTKTATVVKVSSGWGPFSETTTYLKWEVHYKSDLKMHNTVFTDTTSVGEYVPYKTGNTVNKINNETAIQAYEGRELISGNEVIDGKTITFTLHGENEYSGNADALHKKYTTDAKLVYFVRLPNDVDPASVISTYSLVPNGIEAAAITGKGNAAGNVKDVTVKFMRSENGGEPALIDNDLVNGGLWAVMTDKDDKVGRERFLSALEATETDGVFTAQMNYKDPRTYLRLTDSSNATTIYKDGDSVQLDLNGDGVLNYMDLFVVDINDKGANAEITLTNYAKVPVSVSFRRTTADGEEDALLQSGNAPKLYAVMLDDAGNAISEVVQLNGTNANGLLGYSGDLYPNGNGSVALLTLKDNKQFSSTFSTELFNVCQNGGVVAVNMDNQNGNAPCDFFAANFDVDAASGATHIKLLNRVETETVTLKLEQYDETTGTTTAVDPYNSGSPNLYLAYIGADGNAYSKVTSLTRTDKGTYTAQVEHFTGAESELNVLVRVKENEGPENNYYNANTANKVDRYYASKLTDTSVPVECSGPANNNYSLSMDEFFRMSVSEKDGGTLVQLTNDRASALQGLVDAYNGGKLEVNEETGSFEDYDGGKYFNELSPIGIAGSFHIVAFDTANLNAHTNGNVLANVLNANNNFGTNGYPFELSYVVDYKTVHTTSASSSKHILALGAGNQLAVSEQGGSLNVGVNGVRISTPDNVIIDKDPANPFIDIAAVEREVKSLSATLATNETIGISEEFTGSYKYLRLISNSGAGYYNMHASDLAAFGSDLRLAFSDQNKGSIVMNIDCSGMSEINMPERALVNINGKDQGTSEVTTFENGKVIWNFINCEGTTINVKQTTGMILAPGATVNLKANVNGTVIADTVNVDAESHRTDFTGTITKTTGAFEAIKQVNGKTPAADEKFTFVLEQKIGDDWQLIETVQNNGSAIKFKDITFDVEGTYTYRFRELGEGAPEGYQTSGEVYYMEVKVYSSTTQLGDKAFGKEYRRWKEGGDGQSCDFIFHNSKATADLCLIKKDSKNETKLLEGAVFEVWQGETKIATYTTNDQGRVYLSGLENGTYTLKEVTAPFGYELPEIAEWTFTKDDDLYTLGGTYENAKLEATELTINNEGVGTKEIYVRKTWTDNNNQNGNRPDSITVVLTQNGSDYKQQTITPDANGNWEYTFTDLPVYDEQNKEYEYAVKEAAVTGYISQVNGYTINNFEQVVGISGMKSWQNDNEYAWMTRPASVTIILKENGNQIDSKTVTANDGWRYSFENLPAYKNKQPVSYTVEEVPVPGYAASRNGNDFINTLETTEVKGTKTWNDNNNEHGLRPASITVKLMATINGNTSEFRSMSVSDSNSWSWSWSGLPTKKLENGNYYDITYSVEEIVVPGYETSDGENGGIVNTLETLDISGTKEWDDQNNKYDTRPASITIRLQRNGADYKSVTTTADKNWAWSFNYLPKYDANGVEYSYTIAEDQVYGYQTTCDQATYTVTNTLETVDFSGVKGWDDENDFYGLRPENVTIRIMNGTNKVAETVTTAAKYWVWNVTGLPKYDKNTGVAIQYTLDETPSAAYVAVIDGMTVENQLKTIDLEGFKTWQGDEGFEDITRPEEITITATSKDGSITKETTASAPDWTWAITDLPQFDADGAEIEYVVTEDEVTGYDLVSITQNENTKQYEIINKVVTTSVSVLKDWDDDDNAKNTRPTEIQVVLKANDTEVGEAVTLNDTNSWAHTWIDLPEKDSDGYLIDYDVDEVVVPAGYVKTITGSQTTGFVIKNIYVFGTTAKIEATKTLESPNALKDGQFTFILKDAEGKVIETVTNDKDGNIAFTELAYDKAGTHTYTITEQNDGIGGYTYDSRVYTATVTVTQDAATKQLSAVVTYSLNGSDVAAAAFENTYTLEPVEVNIPVAKELTGTEGKESVPGIAGKYTFTISAANGTPMPQTKTIKNDGLSTGFGPIKYTAAGTYTYTITESGFVAGIVNDAAKTVTVTVTDNGEGKLVTALANNTTETVTFKNEYTTIDLEGTKTWKGDEGFEELTRPEKIVITATATGANGDVYTKTVEATDATDWAWVITEMPKFGSDDSELQYTITEEEVPGYETVDIIRDAETGKYEITNAAIVTDVSVQKIWESETAESKRPESIQVQLKVNGTQVGELVTLNDANSWAYTWTNLPAHENITYVVDEVSVPEGYEKVVSGDATVGFTIKNIFVDDASAILKAQKTLTGPNALKDGQFTFVLADAEGTVVDTVTNNAAGEVTFKTLSYEAAGTYTYTITEQNDAIGGYTYDSSVYTVVVEVAQDATTKQLSTKITYKLNGEVVDGAAFKNTYTLKPVDITIPVAKELLGTENKTQVPDISGKYTFTITGSEGAPMPADDEITNADAAFGKITFAQAGTYTYTITESGYVAGIVNDAIASKTVTVVVTDNGKGELVTDLENNTAETVTFRNTYETVDLSGEKVWEGDTEYVRLTRPDSITINVIASGVIVATADVTADDEGNWSWKIAELPKFDKNNTPIAYSIEEVKVNGYTTSTAVANGVYTITNKLDTVDKNGGKVWANDSNNKYETRPESITIYAMNGSTVVDTTTTNAEADWQWKFTGLPKFNKDGTEIAYTFEEELVPGYTTTKDGNNFVNTLKTVDVDVEKVWDDENNLEGFRPATIELTLIKTVGDVEEAMETVPVSGGMTSPTWHYSWFGLPAYEGEEEIVYTVTETPVANYDEPAYEGNTITNSREVEYVDIPVTKDWKDNNDAEGFRPDSVNVYVVKVTVDADDPTKEVLTAVTDKVALSEANSWAHTFEDLIKYEGGKEIVYRVAEDAVENYTTSISGTVANGFIVTNSHTDEFVELKGIKVWDDASNVDGKRPETLKIYLVKNNVTTTTFVEVSGDADRSEWKFENLPKYEDGEPVVYTAAELTVDGYESVKTVAEDGTITFTNTHEPETKEIPVTKTWDDDNDRDDLRPDSLKVTLLADGQEQEVITLGGEGNVWKHTFTDLPVYKIDENNVKGVEIIYTIVEEAVPGYTATQTGFDLKNTHAPEKITVTANKAWNDDNNQDGLQPAKVSVQLKANGSNVGDSVELSAANGWSTTWIDLPKFDKGVEIDYTVEETVVPAGYTVGYSKAVNGNATTITVTNTHTSETINIPVTKIWDDANNQDGKRPASITYKLWQTIDGVTATEPYATKTVTVDDGWNWTFTDLPAKAAGKTIVYTVTEDALGNGYKTPLVTGDMVDGFEVTNSRDVEKISVTGTKIWDDFGDQDGKRPESITITLLADGEKVETKTFTAELATDDNTWAYQWTGLPKYRDAGVEIVYTIEEAPVSGYTADDEDDLTITNSYEPEKVNIPVSKVLNDNNNQDGKQATEVTVHLWAGSTEVGSQKLNAANSWKHTWTGLDKYADGKEIIYTITEDAVAGYNASITGSVTSGFVVTNTHTPEKVEASGFKTWDDKNDHDGFRPESITITLKADGVTALDAEGNELVKVVTEEDGWKWTFTGLDKYKAGKEIIYTVEETLEQAAIDAGYTITLNGMNVTNAYAPGKTTVSGTKIWDDFGDQDGKQPDSITVTLYADNAVAKDADGNAITATVSAATNWRWSFTDLDKYQNGKEISYTVKEDVPEGYTAEYAGNNIINHYTPETVDISGTKTWDDAGNQDGIQPASITVTLMADGVAVTDAEGKALTATVTAATGWAWSFTDLPKFKAGTAIAYTVVENVVPGYEADYAAAVIDDEQNTITLDITNTHEPKTTDIEGSKTWDDELNVDGKRPEEITIHLWADDKNIQTVTVTEANGWAWSFTDLPVYKAGAQGVEIVYTVTEDKVEGYNTSVDDYDVTNTHEPETIEIPVTKVWDDNDNQDGKQPDFVVINLFADGVFQYAKTVKATDNWSCTFTDLPKYKTGSVGVEIVYTITEEPVANYDTTITGDVANGFTVTNKHEPLTTTVSGSKTWNDKNDQDGKRPDSITINLLANGEIVKTISVTEANGWAWSFEDLPCYKAGVEQIYTITENPVGEYETTYNGYNVINSTDTASTFVSVRKVWDDANNQDGLQPAEIKVQLYANGTACGDAVTLNSDNNWAHTWMNLDKKAGGADIAYTVDEVSVPTGYTKQITGDQITGYVITNKHAPEKTAINGTKTWVDANDQDDKRPDTVIIELLANGTKVQETEATGTGNTWTWSFENLDKKANGVDIVYTVNEIVPAGYTAQIDGYDIVNTHEVDTLDIEGIKKWVDNENQDGIRPDSVTITLYADGVSIKTTEAKKADNYAWSFTDLPVNKAGQVGQKIVYTVDETAVPNGYTKAITGSVADGFTVTNTHAPEKVEISGTKVWSDAEDQDGIRPDSITINLLADGDQIKSVTATKADGYAWSFGELDKFKAGKEIVYTVTENAVPGYTTGITGTVAEGFVVTNTHEPEQTKLEGVKIWVDDNNRDGIRPESVTIKLIADGVDTGITTTTTVDENGNYVWSFTGLDKFKAGKEIKYTAEEVVPTGYEASYSDNTTTITNTHEPETTEVEGTKTWRDNENQDGKRPAVITIRLLADGVEQEHVNVTAADNWSWSFTGLPKYKTGAVKQLIIYTIAEDAVAEYTTTPDGYNVINTHNPEKIDLSGSKTWDDAHDQDGKRPTSITITLLGNGQTVRGPITVTEADNWSWKFEQLDKYSGGKEIIYTVVEETVEGYTTVVTGMDVTNSYTPGKTSLSGTKVWKDNNDQDGIRPASITVNLMKQVGEDGDVVSTGKSVSVTEADGWSWSFTGLDEYESGKKVTYSVTEDAVDKYETDIEQNGTNVTITNTYKPETTRIEGSKTWNDAKNQDGKRPTRITINLLADGVEVDDTEVSAANGWSWEFKDLPKYRDHGTKIIYTITEDEVELYETEIDGYNVTNTYEPETISVKALKVWEDNDNQDGKRPASISVQLMADNAIVGEAIPLNEANGWTTTWTDLPKYRDMGTEIVYTVVENDVPADYQSSTAKSVAADGTVQFTITNTDETDLTSISGTKVWADANNQDGIRPTSITVNLLANGEKVQSKTVVPNQNGDWAWTFDNLVKYEAGQEIKYTFTEEAVAGYTTTYSADTTTITNTHAPDTVKVEGSKEWDDANNQDGKRPASITINLLADGQVIETKTVTEADGWKWSFTDLPKFEVGEQGKEVVYTITEDEVEYYETDISGYNVKNTHVPTKVTVEGTKTWNDANDQDGLRPTSITINLLADGEVVDSKIVTVGTNNWSWKFENLDEFKNGNKIVYTIEEVITDTEAAAAYDIEINGYDVTNTYEPETIEIVGSKTWNDANDQDGFRPESITINLLADGVEIAEKVIVPDENGVWPEWKFTGLPKYRDHGTEIFYQITEDAVEKYTGTIDGWNAINSYEPKVVEVSGAKTWADADNQDGKRPESITIHLLADGEVIKTEIITEADGWAWSFQNLPWRAAGKDIVYTIQEDEVAEYTTEINGFSAVNTHQPETVVVEGAKTWTDADNQDGKRPAYITINLLADGTVIDTVNVTAADGWKWSFEGLPKYKVGEQGQLVTYSITEEAVAEYTTEITGYDVENIHQPETVVVEGTKTWYDANDQDGKRPTSITINLLADGEIIDSVTLLPDADGVWPGWKFEDLPKYKVGEQGQLVTYTVTENAVEEYTTTITGYNVTNAYTPGVTSVSVSKAWNDDNDRDGYRPESITFNLLADGVEIDEVVLVPDADGNWPTYTFTELPIYEVGKVGHKLTYTVTEDPVAEYTTTFTGDAATGYYYTNTHEIETVEVSGAKTWTDANDQDGKRPAAITINLLADGIIIDTVTVTEAEEWKWSFTDLPKYRDHGMEIVYTITEDEVAEYTTVITGYDVENIHEIETVEVSGSKTWTDADNQDGKRPAAITINLLADGIVIDTATVTEADEWKWSFTELPKYKAGAVGQLVTYTITEDAVAEYTTAITGYDVENTHDIELIDIAGAKTWTDADNQDGKRPAYITINLLADGIIIDTVNVTAENNWSWSFEDLPKYKAGEQGVEIAYTITENAVAEYTTVITGYDVENIYVPETVEVSGSKTWTDADNQDGKRPASININLLADGEVIKTVTVTEADEWKWSFTDLPKYKVGEEGQIVTYTITEDAVAEYTTVINGYDVENIYVPETVEVAGTKTWTDADNQDGKRPDSVTINLLANGEKINYLTAAADDNWSWCWTDLPKYENGVEIVYTITEEPVAEYTSVITGYDVENIYEPELISIEGTKTWNDANDQDGVRPASINISLMDGDTVLKTVTVTEADGWKWSFTDLPKYRPGKVAELMVYTVAEELDEASAAQYTATVNGYDITNTHEVETVAVEGTKTWIDYDNKYLKRPESITIRLYADGVEIDKAVVTAEDGWAWSFGDLPKYKAGAQGVEVVYTISEDAVNGYVTTVEGYNVFNTITVVGFIKVDEQTGNNLPGAKFALYEGGADSVDGKAPIMVWTSGLEAELLAGLKVGQTYTVVETEAPAGFALMAPFVFTVEITDVPETFRYFTATNCHVYRFRKLDSSNNGLVSGAKLAIMQGNEVIESWVTDTDNNGWYEVLGTDLVPGTTYTLVELEVPAGYLQAEPINFTVDANDGLLIVNGVDTDAAEIVMYDAPAPQATPAPEPATTSLTVTKRWEDKDNVLGKRPSSITVHLYRKLRTDAEWPTFPFMTVNIADNGKDVWKFKFSDLPRKNADGVRYEYMIREEQVEGYVTTYQNNGRVIVNTIPEEDYPPTPTPTLPYYTPTPAPEKPRVPQGVRFLDGEWFYIDEYGIPLGGVPMTGDDTNFILWGMAIGLPMLVAVLAAVEIRRRKKLLACAEQEEEVDAEE